MDHVFPGLTAQQLIPILIIFGIFINDKYDVLS